MFTVNDSIAIIFVNRHGDSDVSAPINVTNSYKRTFQSISEGERKMLYVGIALICLLIIVLVIYLIKRFDIFDDRVVLDTVLKNELIVVL